MPFRDITGHVRTTALLSRAVRQGTLPSSFLFAGPHGVGKRLTAQALAEVLNCVAPVSGAAGARLAVDACGTCPPCRRIGRGTFPDVVVVEPGDTGAISIEQVREVIRAAGYRPFEGRRRVVVVDSADAMMAAAQSALLKTLEEPPPATVFVLVSSTPDVLLPTVRSRCSRLRFGPLAPAEVAALLERRHGYSAADARAAAAEAGGSVARALATGSADVLAARDAACRVLEQVGRSRDAAGRLAAARSLDARRRTPAEERAALAIVLRVLLSLLRDLQVLGARADAGLLANGDLRSDLEAMLPAWDGARVERAFVAVDRALGALDRNASAKVVADWVYVRI
ncbi:MAG: DNA polymerase III subunit delta' [Acidimicrobiia bacterium]|nr:DNA polymerase III subunit delta' [Acidimicrobiia bacterium]